MEVHPGPGPGLLAVQVWNDAPIPGTCGAASRVDPDGFTAYCDREPFADKKSGKNALRPELKACHAFLDAGDTLVVPSLDRYGRSLQDLINMVAELRDRGIGFTSLHENLDTTTPGGRLVFHVFAGLAEFIRELIVIEVLQRCRSRVSTALAIAVMRFGLQRA